MVQGIMEDFVLHKGSLQKRFGELKERLDFGEKEAGPNLSNAEIGDSLLKVISTGLLRIGYGIKALSLLLLWSHWLFCLLRLKGRWFHVHFRNIVAEINLKG